MDAFREELKIDSQEAINEREMFNFSIFDYIQRAKDTLGTGNMPTIDQVRREFEVVCGGVRKDLQAGALRQALGKWTDYKQYRDSVVRDRKTLDAAGTTTTSEPNRAYSRHGTTHLLHTRLLHIPSCA